MSPYPILFHPRSTKQNSSSIIQNNKPARAEDAGVLGIRSFGSNLSLCMGGKSTQASEDMLSVVPPSGPYLRLQDQML